MLVKQFYIRYLAIIQLFHLWSI